MRPGRWRRASQRGGAGNDPWPNGIKKNFGERAALAGGASGASDAGGAGGASGAGSALATVPSHSGWELGWSGRWGGRMRCWGEAASPWGCRARRRSRRRQRPMAASPPP